MSKKTVQWVPVAVCVATMGIISCAWLVDTFPIPTPPLSPTPYPTVAATQTPITPGVLRELTVENMQMSVVIVRMNELIAVCNATPEICQDSDMVIWLNGLLTSLENALLYSEFLVLREKE